MIRGKKQWLPPIQLVYGVALLFKVDESCIGRHFWERRPWGRDGTQEIPSDLNSSLESMNQSLSDVDDKSPSEAVDEPSNAKVGLQEPRQQEHQDDHQPQNQNSSDQDEDEGESRQENDRNEDEAEKEQGDQDEEFPDTHIDVDIVIPTSLTEPLVRPVIEAQAPKKKQQDSKNQRPEKQESKKPGTPRGKRGKMKKIKDRYAEQSEEERAVMIELLGSAKGPQPKGKKAKAKALKQQQLEEQKARREETQKQPRKVEEADESKEVRRILEEENVPILEDEQVDQLTSLDVLTGQPHSDDVLLHAVPVCAPWIALQKYKYKIKIIPGSLKRGKASKQAQSAFLNQCDAREKDLVKAVPDAEWIYAMLPKVKLMVSSDQNKKGKKK